MTPNITDMLYTVKWAKPEGPRADSKFATWDGRVTSSSPVLSWLVGKKVESAIRILEERYGGRVTLVEGSWNINKVGEKS